MKRAVIVLLFCCGVAVGQDDVKLRVATHLELLRMSQKPPPVKPKDTRSDFRKLWDTTETDFPKGLTPYKPTRYSQRIAITGNRESLQWYKLDQDDHWANAPTAINPNRIFPWATSGGMHDVTGWNHVVSIALPADPTVWKEPMPIANGGNITGWRWTFPDGTVTSDMLTKDGKVFELRTRTKSDGKWIGKVEFRDKTARPEGYTSAGKACAECHDHAGSSLQYGIVLRGGDTVFSYSPWGDD